MHAYSKLIFVVSNLVENNILTIEHTHPIRNSELDSDWMKCSNTVGAFVSFKHTFDLSRCAHSDSDIHCVKTLYKITSKTNLQLLTQEKSKCF